MSDADNKIHFLLHRRCGDRCSRTVDNSRRRTNMLRASVEPGLLTQNPGDPVREEVADDLLGRGYSRRQLFRIAAVFSSVGAVASFGRPVWASGGIPDPPPEA